MKLRLCGVLLCAGLVSSAWAFNRPMFTRYVELWHLPLQKGERIASIRLQVAACVSGVAVPLDWRMSSDWPDFYEGTIIEGEAGHGASWVDSGEEFGSLLRLSFYDADELTSFKPSEHVKVTLVTWINGETCRTSSVPAECVYVTAHPTEPLYLNRATNRAAAATPAPAGGR